MTIRLSAMFEEHMRRILTSWKSAHKQSETKKTKPKGKKKQKNKKKKTNLSNGTGKYLLLITDLCKHNAIKYKFYCAGPSKSKSTLSDEDDIDSEDDYDDEESGKEQKKKNFDISAPGTRVYLLFQIITFIHI